jgi:hypothetical protein
VQPSGATLHEGLKEPRGAASLGKSLNAVAWPIAAVGSDGDGNFVYTITDNRITILAVKTGLIDNSRIEVTAGLLEERRWWQAPRATRH